MSKRKRNEGDEGCRPQVGYAYSENLVREASKLANAKGRALVVHKLIESYDLLRNTVILKSEPTNEDELLAFHSSDYVQYLREINRRYTPSDEVALDFGLGYDCPPLDGIFDYCLAIGGSTIASAKAINNGEVDIAINWFGGWHHAQRDEAEGFCYVNDVVLGILELRKCFNYILYVDLDVHHGNGVQSGFELTSKVVTLSFHQYECGFYPGTGAVTDIGSGIGKYHSINVPLREGIGDAQYCNIFDKVWNKLLDCYEFDAVVVQCGADGLAGDPLGGFNLTEKAYEHCLKQILVEKKPTLVLGGGGYNLANTARLWAHLTALIVESDIDPDIPEHGFFSLYGPSYELQITPGNRKDANSQEYLDEVFQQVRENLEKLID